MSTPSPRLTPAPRCTWPACPGPARSVWKGTPTATSSPNFGTAQPQWKGAAGATLLAEAARRVREAGFEIGNVAVQLVGARPRVAGRMSEASQALSQAAGAPVSFSATTTDHLGFLGREEGLLAIASALVYPAATATPGA